MGKKGFVMLSAIGTVLITAFTIVMASMGENGQGNKEGDKDIGTTNIGITKDDDNLEKETTVKMENKGIFNFEKTSQDNLTMGSSNIASMYTFDKPVKHSLFIGQVITCFGEPDYVTENNENLCSWAVKATNEAGAEVYLEIYYGSGGPAIGGKSDEESKKAAEELVEIIKEAEPSDFHYESIYEDFGVKVEMGVKDGVPYYK